VKGCDYRSREHRASWRRWRRWAIAFQISIAALAAIGGSALLAGAEEGSTLAIIAGGVTIAGSILTAASDAISPGRVAEEHRRAAVRFGALGVAFNTFVRTSKDDEQATAQFETIEAAHQEAEQESPPSEAWDK
jgi:hypothetical protein